MALEQTGMDAWGTPSDARERDTRHPMRTVRARWFLRCNSVTIHAGRWAPELPHVSPPAVGIA